MNYKCRCSAIVDKKDQNCAYCGLLQFNGFFGERFPPGYISPNRKIIKEFFYDTCLNKSLLLMKSAGEFCDLSGAEKWDAIAEAIERADVCIFDITGEIFNVGFELGYSLSKWKTTENKKYIILGSSQKPSNHKIQGFMIQPLLPQKKSVSTLVESLFKGEGLPKTVKSSEIEKIEKCRRSLANVLFINNMSKHIDVLYKGVDYPGKKPEKKLLIITTKSFKKYFPTSNDDLDLYNVKSLDEMGLFTNYRNIANLMIRINTNIITKFDFVIFHLLDHKHDQYKNYRVHNFHCGIIGGLLRGFNGKDYYFAHSKNSKCTLRCSDVEEIQRYKTNSELTDMVNVIIRADILPT